MSLIKLAVRSAQLVGRKQLLVKNSACAASYFQKHNIATLQRKNMSPNVLNKMKHHTILDVRCLTTELEKLKVSDEENLAGDLENWMAKLPDYLRKLPLIHLAIPGTHNTGTFDITPRSEIAPDAPDWMVQLEFLGIILTSIMSRWSICQDYITEEQLKNGIRYFDFRVATKPDDVLHFVHSLYGAPLPKALVDINNFLDAHPKEVVILDFQHFYDLVDSDHDGLLNFIQETFGSKLVPFTRNMTNLTLDHFQENNQQVLVVYRSDRNHPHFPSNYYPTPWPNTTNPSELLTRLNEGLEKRDSNFGYVSQFILTPDALTIAKDLFCGSILNFSAKPLYTKHIDWVQDQIPGVGGINVVIGDFVNIEQLIFTQSVINLNAKLNANKKAKKDLNGSFTAVEM